MLNPRRFIQLAREIIVNDKGNSEAHFRTAINRSYFSVHLTARESLIKRGRIRPNTQGIITHKAVIRALPTAPEPELGDQLDYLYEMRKKADYDLASQVSVSEAESVLKLSEELISKIDSQDGGTQTSP